MGRNWGMVNYSAAFSGEKRGFQYLPFGKM